MITRLKSNDSSVWADSGWCFWDFRLGNSSTSLSIWQRVNGLLAGWMILKASPGSQVWASVSEHIQTPQCWGWGWAVPEGTQKNIWKCNILKSTITNEILSCLTCSLNICLFHFASETETDYNCKAKQILYMMHEVTDRQTTHLLSLFFSLCPTENAKTNGTLKG